MRFKPSPPSARSQPIIGAPYTLPAGSGSCAMSNVSTKREDVQMLCRRLFFRCEREAATTMGALLAERDAARAERDAALRDVDECNNANLALVDERAAALAEAARLREALEPIYAAADKSRRHSIPGYPNAFMRRILIADAALERIAAALDPEETGQ